MPKLQVPFVGEAYNMSATQLDAQTCINWYLTNDSSGKFSTALLPRPGLPLWAANVNANSVRGMFELNNELYVVVDNAFRVYDTNGNARLKGTLKTSVGDVRFIANDAQVFVTDGRFGYVYQIISSSTHSANDFFIIEEATSSVGAVTFVGAGTNDMTAGDTFTGSESKDYRVEIDSVGSGSTPDTFRWSDTDGDTWNAEKVQITGLDQTLNDGVTVSFVHSTTHTLNDYWKFATTIDSAFYVPLIPAYQDGYGFYIKQVSTTWYISSINDFSLVNAADFAKSNALPDNLVAAISIKEELWFLCRDTAEVWYNTGSEAFPFQRRTNLVMNYGCLAPYSLAVGGSNLLFWLARNQDGGRVVVMMESYVIQTISTEALNAELEGYSKVDDAKGWVEQWDGHLFFVLTLPTADRTWVFDLTVTKALGKLVWHERRTRYENTLPASSKYRQGRWIANNHVYFNEKHLVGDWQTGNIYQFSRDTYTDNDVPITRERTTQNIQETLNRVTLNSIHIDLEMGVGLTTGQGSDPQVMLQISRDSGKTWGNELWRTIGALGEYKTRAKWNRLGTARSFTFRIRITDPVYSAVLGSVAEIEDTGS